MAQTEHLPIDKAAYDLCLYFEQVVRNFSRYQKYSLGQDLRDGARRVLKLRGKCAVRQVVALWIPGGRQEPPALAPDGNVPAIHQG